MMSGFLNIKDLNILSPPEKTALRKPSLIGVKVNNSVYIASRTYRL